MPGTPSAMLAHGGAGGVGTATIQLGRAPGLQTIAVVGDQAKQQFALPSGADHAVLASGWLAAMRDPVGDRGSTSWSTRSEATG